MCNKANISIMLNLANDRGLAYAVCLALKTAMPFDTATVAALQSKAKPCLKADHVLVIEPMASLDSTTYKASSLLSVGRKA